MYKNPTKKNIIKLTFYVSILVLMDLCIKTAIDAVVERFTLSVSILVLMDLCIKTIFSKT